MSAVVMTHKKVGFVWVGFCPPFYTFLVKAYSIDCRSSQGLFALASEVNENNAAHTGAHICHVSEANDAREASEKEKQRKFAALLLF